MTTVLMVWDLKPEGSELWREIGGQMSPCGSPGGRDSSSFPPPALHMQGVTHAAVHTQTHEPATHRHVRALYKHIYTRGHACRHMRGRSQSVAQAYCWLRTEAGPAKSL